MVLAIGLAIESEKDGVLFNSWQSIATFHLTLLIVVNERKAQLLEFAERTTRRTESRTGILACLDHELRELRVILDVRLQMLDGCRRKRD